ncbi:type IV pili methyl-accepting chemotaxis transducer N-terminal domain-containing protein [Hydrogenophaga pseudoflava]|uniref:type IV pili methyl-accepting chemotaxis transducer N-terminal domain-containing protein n=1 Tax=Hydrogenophaga pseudoflava TaxID=47421 RepID=UPI0027E54EA2|nr:type IV pili methyl-accepting chemotaxis transducer N-terminal domain-containing protein [Hydrogenophaga pseudoflava]MDQ7743093.1 type IV pili methyl-accepting chemotaxis transducer N-terminal domain-containing protein [Hydrogenophaga pseudoflava]
MQRRHLLLLAAAAPLGLNAQVSDLADAINKAGRQRMLSQRMGKAWLAMVHQAEGRIAGTVLDKSMALFDRQLVELKAFAPSPEIRETYSALEAAWSDYKTALVGAAPSKAGATAVLRADARVLGLAHQGTLQYEAAMGRPVGKLVNIAGRQRMLSQRMAKFYYAATLPVDTATAVAEIGKARSEFLTAMDVLRQAPEATARIREELALADGQWLFFDQALQRVQSGAAATAKPLSDVFVTSENLLSVMDRVTDLYANVKS